MIVKINFKVGLSKQKIKCLFGFHKWSYHLGNITMNEQEVTTISFKNCKCCGKSKLIFIYG